MFNQVAEALTEKTIDQYKIIENEYIILKNYLRTILEKKPYSISKDDIELILDTLEPKKEDEVKHE